VDIHELQLRRMQIPTCCRVYRSWICRKYLRFVGIGCDNSDIVTVAVVDSVIVTYCSHLVLIFQRSWTGKG
jgi:hypothetical protein